MKKRICLFAGYDKQNVVDEYVVYYIKELSKFADIYYFADNDMSRNELNKLDGIAKGAGGKKHGRYDFGSWANLIDELGYEKLLEYDQVLLVNDSCFGPMFDMHEMFEKMNAKKLDAWSVCGNKFMMSFFMCLDKKIVKHKAFRELFENIQPETDKSVVIKKYERGLNNVVVENGFGWDVYVNGNDVKKFYKKNKKDIAEKLKIIPWWARLFVKLKPNKVRLYEDDFILPLFMKMPIMKKMSFLVSESITPCFAEEFIAKNSEFPIEIISRYFKRIGIDINRPVKDVIKYRIKKNIKDFICDRKYRGNRYVVRVFHIPVYIKKMDYALRQK